MLIIPAIDLLDGRVVRLTQGDYNKVKVYSDDPVGIAKKWRDEGAEYLHIVDLNGAKDGKPKNLNVVKRIISETGIEAELGGGIRDVDTIKEILGMGLSKVVLGTKAFRDKNFSRVAVAQFQEKIVFSVDMRNEKIALCGWTEDTQDPLEVFIKYFERIGLKRIIYTDISKDCMMTGPNIAGIKKMIGMTKMEVIASGGISKPEDIKKLKPLDSYGLVGIIIGKALYEGTIKFKEAISC